MSMIRAPAVAPLERSFQEYVLSAAPGIEAWVVAAAPADPRERLGVYADAYRLRLLEVLCKDYPALRALVGAAQFDRLGRAYIDAHPSDTPSVRWFGRHLAAFLRERAPYARRPVLAELAQFEWRQGEALDAPDAPVLSVDQVASIPAEGWAQMRLVTHPSLRRLDLLWNAPALWEPLHAGQKAPKPRSGTTATPWVLWRSGLAVRWRALARDEAAALDAAAAGRTFAAICECIGGRNARRKTALRAASLLKRWVTEGLISAILRSAPR